MNLENYNESVIILRLELINFMCHDHILINFEKQFTCIGGRNGSGKSAIMISLGILFGQRSSNLERGNSFRNLIKTGEQYFIIKCVLNNTKKFEYDFFGDFIYIEKRVTIKNSTFSIYNKSKAVWSHKMEDLEDILDAFNIRLENPLNYLTQEQSKKFLSSADPELLYKLFLKGTEIADIKLINEKYESNIMTLKETIENIEGNVKSIEENLEKETKRITLISNIDNLRNIIKNDENELRWTCIYKSKNQAKVIEDKILNLEKDYSTEQTTYTNYMQLLEDLKVQKDSVIEQTQTMRNDNKFKMSQIEEKISITNKKIRNMENDLKFLKESFNIKKDLLKRLEKINTVEDERERFRNKKIKIENDLGIAKTQQEEINKIYEREKKNKEEQDKQIEEYKKKVYMLQKQIDYCNKQSENDCIHPEMKNILKLINATSFKEKVVGPFCDFIKLKEQKWWKVASIVLQKYLTSFVCFNREDRDKLSEIFKRFNVNFSILVPSSKSGDLIKYVKNPNYKVLLDVIDCKNNIIMNQLIVMANIEEKALIENRTEAYKVIRTDPKNIDCIYTINGDIIKKTNGSISDFAPRKSEKYYFEKPRDKLKNVQSELDLLMKNKPNMKIPSEYEKAKTNLERILHKIDKSERELAETIRHLENAEELFLDKNEVMNNEDLADSYRSLENQINSLNKKIEMLKKNIKDQENDKEDILNTKYPSSLDLENQIQKNKIKMNISKDNLQKIMQKRSELNYEYKEKMNEFEICRSELKKQIPEIENPRPTQEINEEISRLKIEIEETKKIGNKDETQEKINDYLEKKRYYENIIKINKEKIEDVYAAYLQRINKREEIKDFIAKNATQRFEELTLKRGYKGKLKFDHSNEKLFLEMEVHNFGIAGTKETLSGGERSFAAMSLLFSLWPYISCPIRILDEFDVFMDDLNRKYIIQRFIEYFAKSNTQVILITPLNTKDLVNDNVDIRILNPPRE
ncbi:structural maintenance of chromosomes protein [Vairimorpha necatrix]|uniref:Structural maintenance of chromosomes protein n=1 Tax=Vairimorpha necatrix TaxID=6039 RepID=A0AAX4JB38_9MICR